MDKTYTVKKRKRRIISYYDKDITLHIGNESLHLNAVEIPYESIASIILNPVSDRVDYIITLKTDENSRHTARRYEFKLTTFDKAKEINEIDAAFSAISLSYHINYYFTCATVYNFGSTLIADDELVKICIFNNHFELKSLQEEKTFNSIKFDENVKVKIETKAEVERRVKTMSLSAEAPILTFNENTEEDTLFLSIDYKDSHQQNQLILLSYYIEPMYRELTNKIKSFLSKGIKGSIVKSGVDPIDEIKKYKELLDANIISKNEFNAKKKELLGI